MPEYFKTPVFQPMDSNGAPMAGAKLYFYEAGTTSALDVYSDAALSTAISQPVVADSAGRFEAIFMDADEYKVILKTSADVDVWTVDNYTPPASGSTNLINGIATAASARTAIGAGSATDVSSNSSSLSTIESQIAGIPGAALGNMAGEDDVGVDNLATGFGLVCLQRAYYTNSASTSIGTISVDGTVPQSSEGTSVFDQDITTTSATSRLVIKGIISFDSATEDASIIIAVFMNGAASASRAFISTKDTDISLPFECEFEPGAVSTINVLVRVGKTGGTAVLNVNALLGAASISSLVVEEWSTI